MNVLDFDYELPPERIAQEPTARRDASRLFVLDRSSGAIAHRRFADLPQLLRPGDLLVLNDTRVVPARLVGRKASGGRVEVLLVEPVAGRPHVWRALLDASRPPAQGSRLEFAEGLHAHVEGREADAWVLRLEAEGRDPAELLARVGSMPLPPYIRRSVDREAPVDDRERYQTVYAERPGAVAAPTAGLHFTRELLETLREEGVMRVTLTLHVGPGTFLPVRTERVEEHRPHDEPYDVPAAVAAAIEAARRRGGRVVAVGTTVVRALESCATDDGRVVPHSGRSGLFIYPGFRFRVVDALVTNFHLPRSTLLMLVSAFAGRERVLAAYREAVERGYRFYSYGDAMFVGSA